MKVALSDLDVRVMEHVAYKLSNAHINLYPYPHFYVRDVFPADFYADLARNVLAATDYAEEPGHYHGRQFGRTTMAQDIDGMRGFLSKRMMRMALLPFRPQLEERYGKDPIAVYSDCRFIRDGRGYFIGPHTDARWKLLSLLFYLPLESYNHNYGTSIFIPRDPAIVCEGGPHHDFPHFVKIHTAPFLPNSCFGFLKSNKSFHGVEPIEADIQRDVFLYNVYDQQIYEQTHKKPSNAATDEQPAPSTPET